MNEIMDWLKMSAILFAFGVPVALLFGFVTQMLAQLSFLLYAVFGVIFVYAAKEISKEWSSFWKILTATMFLLVIQGIVGLLVPGISWLQWASILSLGAFIQTLAIASLATVIQDKVGL